MERYSRVQRDPHSPLTPLTPIRSGSVFNFLLDADRSRRSPHQLLPTASPTLLTPTSSGAGLNLLPNVQQHRRSSQQLLPLATNNRLLPPSVLSVNRGAIAKRRIGKQEPQTFIQTGSAKMKTINNSDEENTPIGTQLPPMNIRKHRKKKPLTVKQEGVERIPEISLTVSNPRKLFTDIEKCKHQEELHGNKASVNKDSHVKKRFNSENVRLSSPVAPKPLSPRLGAFLAHWGMNCLISVFERQEIDMQTFCCLTADDLEILGIEDATNRERVMQAINLIAGLRK